MNMFCPLCQETHDSPEECPEVDGEEGDEPSNEEIRANLIDGLEDAHMAVAIMVTFPREDNDIDEMRAESGRFGLKDALSKTEKVAAMASMEERIEELNEVINGDGPGGGMTATAIPASALFGGGDDDLPDTDGGGMFR